MTFNKLILKYYLCLLVVVSVMTSCQNSNLTQVKYSIQTAVLEENSQAWHNDIKFVDDHNLDLGFFKGKVWIKVDFEKTEKLSRVVLLCNDLINRNYRFYKWDSNAQRYSYLKPDVDTAYQDHRSVNFSKPNFVLELSPTANSKYLISTSSDGRILQATPSIITVESFSEIQHQTLVFDTIFYGAIFIILIINLFYSRLIKNSIYFYYCIYIVFGCLMYLFVEGRLYGIGLSHLVVDHFMFIAIRLWILTSILFCTRFLETKITNPKFYRFIKMMLFLTLGVPTVYQLVYYNSSVGNLHMLENIFGFIWIILAFTIVFIALKKRKQKSTYYLISYSVFVLFVTLGLVDSHTTILPGDPFSYFKIGTIFEFIGFTYFISILVKKKLIVSQNLENELQMKQLELDKINNENAKKIEFAGIFKLIENSLNNESEWDQFKNKLSDLSPNFLESLVNMHNDLTKSEVRLLTLIRVGYSQKEIAEVLKIAPDSVKKARSRARKKMKLNGTINLKDYLKEI